MQDCMQLSVQQFLSLLGDRCYGNQSSKATGTSLTRDVGVQCTIPDVAHKEVQTDPGDGQSVPPSEIDIPRDTPVPEEPEVMQTEPPGKRTREDSPTQSGDTEADQSSSETADSAAPCPSAAPALSKRARVTPDDNESLIAVAGEQLIDVAETTAPMSSATSSTHTCGGGEISTLQIQIGPPDRQPGEAPQQRSSAVAVSGQNRGRQRISFSGGDDPPLMRPPPLPSKPPPVTGRHGSVSPAGLLGQPPFDPPGVGRASVRSRSRSAQRSDRFSDGCTSGEGIFGRRPPNSNDQA